MENLNENLLALKKYYDGGNTRDVNFRLQQLKKLSACIKKNEAEIMAALFADLGKSTEEAYSSEIALVLNELRHFIKKLKNWARPKRKTTNFMNLPGTSKVYFDPYGVVLIIAPWNYPFQLTIMPLVGAIGGGNCVVVKPSEMAPATAAIIKRLLVEMFPENYVLCAEGDGAVVVPAMMNNFRFDHIFFTGSTSVGKIIYQQAAKDLVPVVLELGGKSPAVVGFDANITTTAQRLVLGKFLNAGQTCIAPDYLLVHQSIKEKLLGEIEIQIKKFYGNDIANGGEYPKIINQKRLEKLVGYLPEGNIILGGKYDASKLFFEPTILENVSLDSPLMKEEIFGPVWPIFSFDKKEEALAIVQKNENPLAFYLFGDDANKNWWMQHVAFGGGCINNTLYQLTNGNLPFGGVGQSGIGAYHGKYSFHTFTHEKAVLHSPNWFNLAIKYPPFKGKLKWLRWLMR